MDHSAGCKATGKLESPGLSDSRLTVYWFIYQVLGLGWCASHVGGIASCTDIFKIGSELFLVRVQLRFGLSRLVCFCLLPFP